MIDIHRLERENKTLFKILLEGLLTQQEYEVFRSHFESEVRHYKAVRVVFEMADDLRWEPRSQWRDLKFDSNHSTNIYKIAIIGENQAWRDWAQRAFSPMKVESLLKFSPEQKPLVSTWIDL